jgi:hypothetical protein
VYLDFNQTALHDFNQTALHDFNQTALRDFNQTASIGFNQTALEKTTDLPQVRQTLSHIFVVHFALSRIRTNISGDR